MFDLSYVLYAKVYEIKYMNIYFIAFYRVKWSLRNPPVELFSKLRAKLIEIQVLHGLRSLLRVLGP